ncbi:hypothetical protein [Thermogemmatispora tikiterensis]|uniref:hypothetical protein n=1 Tax=Thermogemmatispora tikiterensis TaxID=1825093 RepID=UPI0011BED3F2|nr:hypothetical protein [Thermogemmatispora tikiterensis]
MTSCIPLITVTLLALILTNALCSSPSKVSPLPASCTFFPLPHTLALTLTQVDHAATLLALNWPREALDDLPTRQLSGMARANAYAELLAVEAYAHLGRYEQAAALGLEAIPVAHAIQSQVNLERARQLMERLAASLFGGAPEVARLRLRLNRLHLFWDRRCSEAGWD